MGTRTTWRQSGSRISSCWHSPSSALLTSLSTTLAISLFASLLLLTPGCGFCLREELPAVDDVAAESRTDSIPSVLLIHRSSCIGPVADGYGGTLDLFVCKDEGTRPVEIHRLAPYLDTLLIWTSAGDKLAAAVLDSPYLFNDGAVPNMDALEQVRFDFRDEDPDHPSMSGVATFAAGDTVDVSLEPLLSCVIVNSVTNMMGGYALLESPRAILTRLNPDAELFRKDGFCPTSISPDSVCVALPCDIGLFTQYPSVALFCYPNDCAPFSASNPPTVLSLSGICNGHERVMSVDLPPLRRNSIVRADFEFDDNTFRATVY